jgi:putative glutathione S-transferase
MGMLRDGEWSTDWYEPGKDGAFERPDTKFRGRVTADGASEFTAEAGRYHLYVAWACPWAHRVLLMRHFQGLEQAITISVVDPFMGDDGWVFGDDPASIPDTINGARFLREIYVLADPHYTGRVTVPVLGPPAPDPATSTRTCTRATSRPASTAASRSAPRSTPAPAG